MNQELEAIKAVVDPGEGQDLDKARELSDAYVAAHPEEFADFEDMTIEAVVQAVDVFRAAQMPDAQYRAEAWHLHKWLPQNIGGEVQPQLRSSAK